MKTYYDFFAGGGMVQAGLGNDWRCLYANDICKKKAESYCRNWGSDSINITDVRKVTTRDLPGSVDLAWASFPCQDLSLAGQGHRVARGAIEHILALLELDDRFV